MDAFEFEIDPTHNVVLIRFRDTVSASTMAAKMAAAEAELPKLRRGFTVAADLTRLVRMEIDCVAYLTRMMDLFLAAGVGLVVRIIPDPDKDIGFTLLSHTHYRGRVPIQTCVSIAELTPEIRTAFER